MNRLTRQQLAKRLITLTKSILEKQNDNEVVRQLIKVIDQLKLIESDSDYCVDRLYRFYQEVGNLSKIKSNEYGYSDYIDLEIEIMKNKDGNRLHNIYGENHKGK